MHQIRMMRFRDVPRCARFIAETPLWAQHGATAAKFEAYFRAALDEGAQIFVAAGGGQADGLIWCVERGMFDRSGYVRLLAVAYERRSQGLGGRLLAYAEDFLGQTANDVFLLVTDTNDAAQRFYQRHGYVQVGAVPDYVVPGVTELLYRKRL